jgi:1,4-alpha-glucan branching enzyme
VPAGAPSLVLVHFQFEAPAATEVRLAGDFSSWQPTHTMSRSEAGVWSVVVPLSPGIHEYAFVVDGTRWQVDPGAPAVADGFGGHNSRVAVLTPDVGAL